MSRKTLKINKKMLMVFSAASVLAVAPLAHAEADKAAVDNPKEESSAEAPQPVVKGLGSYLSGRYARRNGDNENAVRYLREVYAQEPGNMNVAGQLQNTLLQEGQIDEAIELSRVILAKEPKDPISNLLISMAKMKEGDFVAASASLDAVGDGANGQLWLPLIQGWYDVGQKQLAKPLTLEGLSANVGRAQAVVNYHLALINAAAGFTQAAAENFRNAIEDPERPPLRVIEALLSFYEKNGRPETLKDTVTSYLDANPRKQPDPRAPRLESESDGVAEVLFTMGSVMIVGNMTPDAVVYFNLALYAKPDFPLALLTLGDAYSEIQQYERSNATYQKISADSPFYADSQLQTALNYDKLGQFAQASAKLDALIKQYPQKGDFIIAKGDLMRRHAHYAEAAEIYTTAIKRSGKLAARHWPLLFARGVAYERMQKWSLAEKDFERALELNPDQPDVANYLAYGWLERGKNKEEALAMLQKAVEARPNDAQILDSMGWAYWKVGQFEKAVPYLEQAVELLPADATVNDHLGDAYWRVGRKTEARFQWERSLSFSPDDKLADALRKKIRDGLPNPEVAESTAAKSRL